MSKLRYIEVKPPAQDNKGGNRQLKNLPKQIEPTVQGAEERPGPCPFPEFEVKCPMEMDTISCAGPIDLYVLEKHSYLY